MNNEIGGISHIYEACEVKELPNNVVEFEIRLKIAMFEAG